MWQRRFPSLRVTIIPSQVQGEGAEAQLLSALKRAAQLQPDVVLLTRGGGSLEDLWSFNLESVARALAACPLPTVSAVGHEIDVTICDFVADVRAPTPSAAAELIVPSATDLLRTFRHHRRQLNLLWHRYHEYLALTVANLRLQLPSPERVLERANQRVDDASQRMAQSLAQRLRYQDMRLTALTRQLQAVGPDEQLQAAQAALGNLRRRLQYSLLRDLQARNQRLHGLSRMLHSVSPLPTLARGFAVVKDQNGHVVTAATAVEPGAQTITYLKDGALISEVKEVQQNVSITD